MKTQHLREDKNCLNCGREVTDRFCAHCGQENVNTKASFAHLVSHVFQDITHYDSKFLTTLKFLFFYPGLLTREYVNGRRVSYVNPIRLYVFTSLIFFLLLGLSVKNESPYEWTAQTRQQAKFRAMVREAEALRDSIRSGRANHADTASMRNRAAVLMIMGTDTVRNSAHLYDSLQQSLPPSAREDWWERKVQVRSLEMRDKYGGNVRNVLEDKIVHNFPKLMFLLLPFFALLLQRFFRRQSWVYTDHAIFSIHFHTFIFMLGIIGILINKLLHANMLYAWMAFPVFLYFVFALRNAYGVKSGAALLRSVGILALYALGSLVVGIGFIFLIFVLT